MKNCAQAGSRFTVRTALQLINRVLDEILAEQSGTAGVLARAGLLRSGAGKVQLQSWRDLSEDFDPERRRRPHNG